MGYSGQAAPIPLGLRGLRSDVSQDKITPDFLIRANNVSLADGRIRKELGSRQWNDTVLAAGVASAFDWNPSSIRQYIATLVKDGKTYILKDRETTVEVTAKTSSDPAEILIVGEPKFVQGGVEAAGSPKKLFLFSGGSQVQVISGVEETRSSISGPAADWATSFPRFAILHRNRLYAFGNGNNPHQVYASSTTDHEDFTTGALTFSVFPGDGDTLKSAVLYRGRLFLFKSPRGVYILEDSNDNDTTWFFRKLSDSFGVASSNSALELLDDLLVGNSQASLTSLRAVQRFGDVEFADVLSSLLVEDVIRQEIDEGSVNKQTAIFYSKGKRAMYTYRSSSGTQQDRILNFDITNPSSPKLSFTTKDQPNFLFLRKDKFGIERPFYGSEDGFIYEMEREDRNVAGIGYRGEFQTPHMDLSFINPGFRDLQKRFDRLEILFEQTGDWDLNVDVFIDGTFTETLAFSQTKGDHLGSFLIGSDQLPSNAPRSAFQPLHGRGRRISFLCYNENFDEEFSIVGMTLYFKTLGQGQGKDD